MAIHERLRDYSQYAELKQLAFRIKAMQADRPFQTLAILSYFPKEGKTLLCAALAMAYADVARSRVAIIDTTTRRNEDSLTLSECLIPGDRRVVMLTMDELRHGTKTSGSDPARPVVHNPEIVTEIPAHPHEGRNTEGFRAVSEEGKPYGLVMMDTVALSSKNRNNVDPYMIARQTEAAVLVVSRPLLNSPEVSHALKVLREPGLHLIGVIANEEFAA